MGENADAPATQDVIQVINHATRDELMSLKINVNNKRLIVALCENDRGRFIKLTDGRARVIVPSEGINQLRGSLGALESNLDPAHTTDHVHTDADADADADADVDANAVADAASQAPSATTALPATGANDDVKPELLDSQRFLCEGRKFYFDVLENARGRFLKISQSSTRRVTLVMPIAILMPLKRAIDMLLDKVPPDANATDPTAVQRITRTIERVTPMNDGTSVTLTVVQREVRVLGKRVVFESGANRRGSYIKIMENSGSQRMAVMLPHSAVSEIIELLQEVVDSGDPADSIPAPAQNGE